MSKRRANGEGNIRKRKDGRWEGRYTAGYDPETGKRIIKNVLGKTQAEAKEKLKQAVEDNRKIDVAKNQDLTVGQWATLWYENYAKPFIRENTAEYYRNYIEKHIIPRIGKLKLRKLTTMLGHYSAEFTLDVYANVTKEMKKEAADKIGSYMEQVI